MKPLAVVAVVHLLSTGVAAAQAQIAPAGAAKAAGDKEPPGWSPFLALTSTVSLTSNTSVVGQVDGFSTLFGLGLTGGTDYIDGPHPSWTSIALIALIALIAPRPAPG